MEDIAWLRAYIFEAAVGILQRLCQNFKVIYKVLTANIHVISFNCRIVIYYLNDTKDYGFQTSVRHIFC